MTFYYSKSLFNSNNFPFPIRQQTLINDLNLSTTRTNILSSTEFVLCWILEPQNLDEHSHNTRGTRFKTFTTVLFVRKYSVTVLLPSPIFFTLKSHRGHSKSTIYDTPLVHPCSFLTPPPLPKSM